MEKKKKGLKKKSSKSNISLINQAKNLQTKRTQRARTMDSKKTAKTTLLPTRENIKKWTKKMGRIDLFGIDTKRKTKQSKKKPPIQSHNKAFQSHNKTYKTNDVINSVSKIVKSQSQKKINAEINAEYNKLRKDTLTRNPNWKMFEKSEEKYLNSLNINKDKIKAQKYGEIIMNAFHKTVGERVRTEKAVVESVNNLNDITPEVLEKNLDVVRKMRKHTVGLKYQKTKKK